MILPPTIFHQTTQPTTPRKRAFAQHLRKRMTRAEQVLWRHLRGPDVPEHVRRQAVIAGYIADFYCIKLRLVIEVDGPIHRSQRDYDQHRDRVMEGLGLRVVRISNQDVLRDPAGAARRALEEGRRWAVERLQGRSE